MGHVRLKAARQSSQWQMRVTAGSPVNLTVERNGQMQQVTVDTAAVARELPDASQTQQRPGPDDPGFGIADANRRRDP